MSLLFVVMGLIGAAVGFFLLRWDGVAIGFVVGALFWMQRELKEELRLVGLRLDALERRGVTRETLPGSRTRPDAEEPPGEPTAPASATDPATPPISKPAWSEPPNAGSAARPEPGAPPCSSWPQQYRHARLTLGHECPTRREGSSVPQCSKRRFPCSGLRRRWVSWPCPRGVGCGRAGLPARRCWVW